MSDPKCKCAASVFSPHRVSKCALRKLTGTNTDNAAETKRQQEAHEEEIRRLKAANEAETAALREQAQRAQAQNVELTAEIGKLEIESAAEKQKRIEAEEQRIEAEKRAAIAENDRQKALQNEKTAQTQKQQAQRDANKAQQLASREMEARIEAEIHTEHVMSFVKLQDEQNTAEKDRLKSQLQAEKRKNKETEKKIHHNDNHKGHHNNGNNHKDHSGNNHKGHQNGDNQKSGNNKGKDFNKG